MSEGYEVIFADINVGEIRSKLKLIGAKQVFAVTQHWLNFEYDDWRLDKDNSWIRLREEGEGATIAYKQRLGPGEGENGNDLGMKEIEFLVDSFEKARDFFFAIGMEIKFDYEKKRERWKLDDIEFDIDTYPLIPALLEIESNSWENVNRAIELLELDPSDKRICTAYEICQEKGINLQDYLVIHFDKQVKRKK